MDFQPSERAAEFAERLTAFMDEHVHPAEPVYVEQMRASGDPHFHPPVLEVAGPAGHSEGLGPAQDEVPESHPLHPARDDESPS